MSTMVPLNIKRGGVDLSSLSAIELNCLYFMFLPDGWSGGGYLPRSITAVPSIPNDNVIACSGTYSYQYNGTTASNTSLEMYVENKRVNYFPSGTLKPNNVEVPCSFTATGLTIGTNYYIVWYPAGGSTNEQIRIIKFKITSFTTSDGKVHTPSNLNY